jgi:hypothetical protein
MSVSGVHPMKPKYQSVNGQWPEGTDEGRALKPTPEEAVTAVRLLWRKFTGKRWRFPVKPTSGNRRGGFRGRVLYVNPDRWGGGWHEVVHMMSHRVAFTLHPGTRAHDTKGRHAFIEREMIKYVIDSGWLEGKLKSKRKPKLPVDPKAVRAARVAARIKQWESKKRRAENALKKLQRSARYYQKQTAPEMNPEPSL